MLLKKYGTELFLLAVLLIFSTAFCNMLFHCGCTWLWAGADSHCNIHHAAPPYCPWCNAPKWMSHGPFQSLYGSIPFILIYFIAVVAIRPIRDAGFGKKAAAGFVVAAIAGVLIGWIYALLSGYPHFLFE